MSLAPSQETLLENVFLFLDGGFRELSCFSISEERLNGLRNRRGLGLDHSDASGCPAGANEFGRSLPLREIQGTSDVFAAQGTLHPYRARALAPFAPLALRGFL